MAQGKEFEIVVMSLSFLVTLGAYFWISFKDRSWITWATPPFLFIFAAEYVLPFAVLLTSGPTGSRYAYGYCYATYALSSLCLAAAYATIKPLAITASVKKETARIGLLPWALLMAGVLLYSPVMVQFRADLLHPRNIYTQTRTGYGVLFFGSSALANVALVVYLFKRRKSIVGATCFYLICATLIFLHGSKGQLVALVVIASLHFIYVKGNRISLLSAAVCVVLFATLVMGSFAASANLSDVGEILNYMKSYADYTRNAMLVMDDPDARPYLGQLTLEAETYSRIPRQLMPGKPKDFGMFKLARIYYPEWYRGDTGSPDFGLGMQYADFGQFAVLYLCLCSALSGWIVRMTVISLRTRPHPSVFLILLLYSNVAVFSVGAGFPLLETVAIGLVLAFALQVRLLPPGFPRFVWLRTKAGMDPLLKTGHH